MSSKKINLSVEQRELLENYVEAYRNHRKAKEQDQMDRILEEATKALMESYTFPGVKKVKVAVKNVIRHCVKSTIATHQLIMRCRPYEHCFGKGQCYALQSR